MRPLGEPAVIGYKPLRPVTLRHWLSPVLPFASESNEIKQNTIHIIKKPYLRTPYLKTMCLILMAYHSHPDYELVLAANRDEFYQRPTQAMGFWQDHPDLLAGRDLEAGGTWLGITRQGRFATVTNYRRPSHFVSSSSLSRGHLTSDFLTGSDTAKHYLQQLSTRAEAYNGFNLLLSDGKDWFYYANHNGRSAQRLPPGYYGLSNHVLDSPWPKVQRGKQALADVLTRRQTPDVDALLSLLEDRRIPGDDELPDTGVGIERERMLAPMFISSASYGTRCSTVLLIKRNGAVKVVEKTHADSSVCEYEFNLTR